MILEVDVGNTKLKWRLLQGASEIVARGELSSGGGLAVRLKESLGETRFDRARMVSVAGAEVADELRQCLQCDFGVYLQEAQSERSFGSLKNPYEDHRKLGADRWLAVLAAAKRVEGACLVVDCGSAITVEMCSGGNYLGGYIVPGYGLMRNALYSDTSQVKVVGSLGARMGPGNSTEQAVNQGLWCALVGLVELSHRQLVLECGEKDVKVLVCGGDGEALVKLLTIDAEWVPDLVMEGLGLACP